MVKQNKVNDTKLKTPSILQTTNFDDFQTPRKTGEQPAKTKKKVCSFVIKWVCKYLHRKQAAFKDIQTPDTCLLNALLRLFSSLRNT